jgi:Stage II sporulation protein E (SpoIIE)
VRPLPSSVPSTTASSQILQQLPVRVILTAAPSGRVVMANAQIEEILGHQLTGAVSTDGNGVYRGFTLLDEPLPSERSPLARAIRGAPAPQLRGDQGNVLLLHTDGLTERNPHLRDEAELQALPTSADGHDAHEILEQIERQSLGPGPCRLADDVAILLLRAQSR